MIRALITYLVPLLAPFVLYALYVRITRAKDPERALNTPWFWLLIVGLVLMIATMFATATFTGDNPDGTYVPPHMEDGRIVPSEVR
jgi:hypothetical protein